MTITFIGHGYVGLVTAAVFADLGNTVWVIGHTQEKIDNLKKGILPIYEPGLEEIVKRNVSAGRLLFTLEYDQAIPASEVVFIAVGTPPLPTGDADLSVVFDVARKIGQHMTNYTVVITKSTVPVGTNRKVKEVVAQANGSKVAFDIASCPEFLREGQAIGDTLNPDRVVIGSDASRARDLLVELHKPISGERILTTIETAEMIKYAANAFLATKISFANAIAQLSEKAGADAVQVLTAVGQDKRVGKAFLSAGAGYGGSCFPKDVKALIAIAGGYGYDFKLLKDVEQINVDAMQLIVEKVKKLLNGDVSGKTIGILGLSFKPDTDDMRDAPSRVVIAALESLGAKIKSYDPIAMDNAKGLMPTISCVANAYEAATDADAVVLMTEWNEFRQLDLVKLKSHMKQPIFVDGRNIYDPIQMKEIGFMYQGSRTVKKILITGASGFIGGFLAEHLLQLGNCEIYGTFLDDKSVERSPVKDKITFIKTDLLDRTQVDSLFDKVHPDQIYHLAAMASVGASFKDPIGTFHANVDAQVNLFESLLAHDLRSVRILIFSSAEIYGCVTPNDLPVDELTPLRPASPYAVSKVTQDFLGAQYCVTYGMQIIRVRPFNQIGPRQAIGFVSSDFAKQIAQIEKGIITPVINVGNLQAKRDFTDVRDAVKAYSLLLDKGVSWEVYNMGSGVSHKIQEILDVMIASSNTKIAVEVDQNKLRPSDVHEIVCNNTKLSTLTGWKPKISFEQTIKDTLGYWRSVV